MFHHTPHKHFGITQSLIFEKLCNTTRTQNTMLPTFGYYIPQLWIVNIMQEMWHLLYQIIHCPFSIGLFYRMKVGLKICLICGCVAAYPPQIASRACFSCLGLLGISLTKKVTSDSTKPLTPFHCFLKFTISTWLLCKFRTAFPKRGGKLPLKRQPSKCNVRNL